MSRIRVIGVGNPLMGDDGLGCQVIAQLQQLKFPPEIELVDGGCGGLNLIHLFSGCEQVIIIDAADFGGVPGEIRQLPAAELPAFLPSKTQPFGHQFALPELLLLAQRQAPTVAIDLFLMQVSSCQPGTELSAPVKAALPVLSSAISATLCSSSER